MNSFFKNKFNIVLISLLSVAFIAIGYFAYVLLLTDNNLYAPDFTNKKIDDVNEWCLETGLFESCVITYEHDDDILKDYVIYQSVKAGDVVDKQIEFIISNGKEENVIKAPILNNTKKEDIANWASENKLTNVKYNYEFNDSFAEDIVFKIEPNEIKDINMEVNVYISLGKQEEISDYIIVVENKYLGLTVDEFKAKVEAIGLKVGDHVSDYDDYSNSYEKGQIIWHGSGEKYVPDEGVRYALSLGKAIVLDEDKYLGLSETEFKKAMEELGLKVYNDKDDKKSSYDKGLVRWYKTDCSYAEGDTVNYSISSGKAFSLDSDKYLGLSEEQFKEAMKELGLNVYNDGDDKKSSYDKGLIRWYKSDISYSDGDTVNYSVSSGKIINLDAEKYLGYSETDFVKAMNDLGLNAENDGDDQFSKYETGTIRWYKTSDVTYSAGDTVKYSISLGVKISFNSSKYLGYTEEKFKSAMDELGLKYEKSSESNESDYEKGQIYYHSSGDFKKGDTVTYKVSAGKKVVYTLKSNDYNGKTEQEFISDMTSKGLGYKTNSEYSDTISNGYIISITAGTYNKGDSVSYIVSKGKKPKTQYSIMSVDAYNSVYFANVKTADDMKNELASKAFKNFTNVTYEYVNDNDYSTGVIISISVNGNTNYSTTTKYDYDIPIVVQICK